jgi:rhodanese-related sulfurtransferase
MASSVYSPRYITAAELHALLQAPDSRAKTLVVDVRDDDREGGHVAGSINVPSQTFGASVTDIEQAAQGKVSDPPQEQQGERSSTETTQQTGSS